jgi:hypothetical protein
MKMDGLVTFNISTIMTTEEIIDSRVNPRMCWTTIFIDQLSYCCDLPYLIVFLFGLLFMDNIPPFLVSNDE